MNDQERMDLVKRMFDEFVNTGGGELLLQHLAEDALWRITAPQGSPLDERFIGAAGVLEYHRRVQELLTTDQIAVTDFFQSHDKVVALGTERLCSRRTGRAVSCDWAMVLTFRQDTIVEVLVLEDLSIVLAE